MPTSRKRKFRNKDATIRKILTETRIIALVGASDKPERPANEVMKILLDYGYEVIPINPRLRGKKLMGKEVLGSLKELPAALDDALAASRQESSPAKVMVDIFRNSKAAAETIEEAIFLGKGVVSSIWMQIGVINEDGARLAVDAGFDVAMDICPAEEIPRLDITVPRTNTSHSVYDGASCTSSGKKRRENGISPS